MTQTNQTHIVLKIKDCEKYLSTLEYQDFAAIVNKVAMGRKTAGKPPAEYLIVNSDEPYFERVYRQVLIEESKKGPPHR